MGVMGTKLNTKAFGQTQTAPTSANSMSSNLSSEDIKKLGGENVGDVLNKVADANYVDPSKKVRAAGNDKLDKDAFFKLMLAQMKNQDPMNPLQSHEMAAQLANFSALEQMQNMNKTLVEMKDGQKPSEQFQILQFLGKTVSGDSSKIFRARGDKGHDLQFDLPMDAKEGEMRIRNADGDVVRTYKLNNLKKGPNRVAWNGLDEKGTALPEGEYQFFMEAKTEAGKKVAIKTDFEGAISGVNYTNEGPVLMVGNQAIRLRDVKKIVDPQIQKNQQQPTGELVMTSPGVKKPAPGATSPGAQEAPQSSPSTSNAPAADSAPKAPAQEAQGAPAAAPKSKILDQVGLSQEMMTKLMKQTN